jgi:two-component system, OmpR family, response regulator
MLPRKIKIVIIDDEEDLCYVLSNMLLSQGFEVDCYYTLESGLTGIEAVRPEWVIMDNDLPDGQGWEKTNAILNIVPGVNIINMSANPDSKHIEGETKVHYLIKPIHVNSIIELIHKNPMMSNNPDR